MSIYMYCVVYRYISRCRRNLADRAGLDKALSHGQKSGIKVLKTRTCVELVYVLYKYTYKVYKYMYH